MKLVLVSSAVRTSASLFPRRRRVALPTQPSEGLNPPTGVHLRTPSEYLPLQHWLLHCLLLLHCCHSPSLEVEVEVEVVEVDDPTQPSEGLNPPTGVHLRTPSEYLLLQHWFLHWVLSVHFSHSPRSGAAVSASACPDPDPDSCTIGTTMSWTTSVVQLMPDIKPAALSAFIWIVTSLLRSHPVAWTLPSRLVLVTFKVFPLLQKNNLHWRELPLELYPTQTLRPQASGAASTFWDWFFLIRQVASNQQECKKEVRNIWWF